MSYTVNIDNTTITVYPGQVDTTTSLGLVGKNVANYGQVIAQDLVSLLSNFSGGSSPASPVRGQIWYDTSVSLLKFYDGTNFKPVRGMTVGSTAPANPAIGDQWVDTANYKYKIYTGDVTVDYTGWFTVGPDNDPRLGKSGYYQETVLDNNSVSHNVLVGYLAGVTVSITSKDQDFRLQTPINAVSNVYTGYNNVIGSMSDKNGSLTSQLVKLRTALFANTANLASQISTATHNITSVNLTQPSTALTPANGDTSNQIATTQFVANSTSGIAAINSQLSGFAPINSPVLTGFPEAPTPQIQDNNNLLATAKYVHTILPYGSIILWYGSAATIPAGWALCDGHGNTPNLMDRVVIGAAGSYAVNTQTNAYQVNTVGSGGQLLPATQALCYIMKVSP